MSLPGYNDGSEIQEILSGFGANQPSQGLSSYSPGRRGRGGRRQKFNIRNVSPLPGSLEEEFRLSGFSNNRNQREIQLTDTTGALVEVEEEEK